MIRLHARPLPSPSSVSKLSLFLSLPMCRWKILMMGEGWGEGAGVDHTTARKLEPL
jgi:hypothetical protein